MNVRDAMTPEPITVTPDTSLRAAQDTMRTSGIHHLPVVDETKRLVGILTDRDVKHAVFLPVLAEHMGWDQRRYKSLRVREVMTWSAVTTVPEMSLTQAAAIMFQRRIGSLPVVDDGRVVGILTETDVMTALRSDQKIEEPAEYFAW